MRARSKRHDDADDDDDAGDIEQHAMFIVYTTTQCLVYHAKVRINLRTIQHAEQQNRVSWPIQHSCPSAILGNPAAEHDEAYSILLYPYLCLHAAQHVGHRYLGVVGIMQLSHVCRINYGTSDGVIAETCYQH